MKNEWLILHFLFRTHFFLSEGIPFFSVSFGFAEALLHSSFIVRYTW